MTFLSTIQDKYLSLNDLLCTVQDWCQKSKLSTVYSWDVVASTVNDPKQHLLGAIQDWHQASQLSSIDNRKAVALRVSRTQSNIYKAQHKIRNNHLSCQTCMAKSIRLRKVTDPKQHFLITVSDQHQTSKLFTLWINATPCARSVIKIV